MAQVTLDDGTTITDSSLFAGGHRKYFVAGLQYVMNKAAQVQAWAAQAQAAAGAGGGTIFPLVSAANAGQVLTVNSAGSAYVAKPVVVCKNYLVNAGFRIWKLGTSFTLPAAAAAAAVIADQWLIATANTGWTAQLQCLAIAGGGLRINCTNVGVSGTNSDLVVLRQLLEGTYCCELAGGIIYVNFVIKTNKLGNYAVTLTDLTANTQIGTQSVTVTSANVKTQFKLQFTAPAAINEDNIARLRLDFALVAKSGNAGVYYPSGGSQVNLLDSTANYLEMSNVHFGTDSDYAPEELWLDIEKCNRYHRRLINKVQNQSLSFGQGISTTAGQLPVFFGQMRTAPSLAFSALGDFLVTSATGGAVSAPASISLAVSTPSYCRIDITCSAGLTAGGMCNMQAANTNCTVDLFARL